MNLSQIIKAYNESAELQNLSDNTKRTYRHYLSKLLEKAAERQMSGEVNLSNQNRMQTDVAMPTGVAMQIDVAFFSSVVFSFKGPQAQRMARRILIMLLGWAERYGMVQNNLATKIPLPKLTAKPRSPFTVAEMSSLQQLLLDTSFPEKLKPYVSEALVAFHTGMRPSELDNLHWDDVGPDYIKVRSAKAHEVGAVARMVKVTEGVAKALPVASSGLVFKSVTGKKLNKDTRSEAINFACEAAGIKARDFYNTRRGTATEMHARGYDIATIQRQLGHADISTTQIYIKPTMEQAAAKFQGF
jgi:integrase